jgi:hypothetical protein
MLRLHHASGQQSVVIAVALCGLLTRSFFSPASVFAASNAELQITATGETTAPHVFIKHNSRLYYYIVSGPNGELRLHDSYNLDRVGSKEIAAEAPPPPVTTAH